MKRLLMWLVMLFSAAGIGTAQTGGLMVRIAEIEIEPGYLGEYKEILKEEARASVRLEPGVISIFPMFEKERPTMVRILEVYRNREAYEAHLKTPHFLKYKNLTLRMVKGLRLVDMGVMDEASMREIFAKIK